MDNEKIKYKIAVASSDGIVVNQHFGRASSFIIYNILPNDTIELVENRVMTAACQDGTHNDNGLAENIENLLDCKYVLVSKIGAGAANRLEQRGVIPVEVPGIIDESVEKLIAYEKGKENE